MRRYCGALVLAVALMAVGGCFLLPKATAPEPLGPVIGDVDGAPTDSVFPAVEILGDGINHLALDRRVYDELVAAWTPGRVAAYCVLSGTDDNGIAYVGAVREAADWTVPACAPTDIAVLLVRPSCDLSAADLYDALVLRQRRFVVGQCDASRFLVARRQ